MTCSQQPQSSPASTCVSTKDEAATPFSQKIIELTQQEYIQLKWDAKYWRSRFERLREKYDSLRASCRCAQKERTIRKLRKQIEENQQSREQFEEVSLQQRRDLDCVNAQLLASQARVDQLQRQLYGRRTEKSRVRCKREAVAGNESEGAAKGRGQQKGSKGPGRTPREKLPTVGEFHDVATDDQMCGRCGKAYTKLSFTHEFGDH